eukprot:629227-Amphidinium_carterae.1
MVPTLPWFCDIRCQSRRVVESVIHHPSGRSNPAAPLAFPAGQLPAECGVCPHGHVRGHNAHTTLCMDSE